jgi:hypothetical protein
MREQMKKVSIKEEVSKNSGGGKEDAAEKRSLQRTWLEDVTANSG